MLPKPVQQPPDVWLGGRAPRSCAGSGELGDGWLAVLLHARERSPKAACSRRGGRRRRRAARSTPSTSARWCSTPAPRSRAVREHGRRAALGLRSRRSDRGRASPALRDRLEEYVAVGFSKLVLVPVQEAESWRAELEELADGLLDLQGTRSTPPLTAPR